MKKSTIVLCAAFLAITAAPATAQQKMMNDMKDMPMGTMVMDKALLEKLNVGKAVDFDFVQAGKGYVITDVR